MILPVQAKMSALSAFKVGQVQLWCQGVVQSLNRVQLLQPQGLQPTSILCPWDFPGKSTRVDNHSLLQGIFQIQGSNPGLLYFRWIFTEPLGKPQVTGQTDFINWDTKGSVLGPLRHIQVQLLTEGDSEASQEFFLQAGYHHSCMEKAQIIRCRLHSLISRTLCCSHARPSYRKVV